MLHSHQHRYTQPLAYVSGRWLLITSLLLSTVPAYAEWVAVERDYLSPGLQTVYIDPDSIRREGNVVTMWQLIDFKWMQGNPRGPTRFLSTKTQKQFDCVDKRFRLLALDREWCPTERGFVNWALPIGIVRGQGT